MVVFEITHDLAAAGDRLARAITNGEAIVVPGQSGVSLRVDSIEMEIFGYRGFEPAGALRMMRSSTAGARQREHSLRVPVPGTASPIRDGDFYLSRKVTTVFATGARRQRR